MSVGIDQARAVDRVNRGFGMLETALALLRRIDYWLERLVYITDADGSDSLMEGGTSGKVTVGTGGITQTGWSGSPNVLEANSKRRGSLFTNTSITQNITLGLGTRQPTVGAGVVLAPGASWDGRISGLTYKGPVAPVADGNGATLAFLEI